MASLMTDASAVSTRPRRRAMPVRSMRIAARLLFRQAGGLPSDAALPRGAAGIALSALPPAPCLEAAPGGLVVAARAGQCARPGPPRRPGGSMPIESLSAAFQD